MRNTILDPLETVVAMKAGDRQVAPAIVYAFFNR